MTAIPDVVLPVAARDAIAREQCGGFGVRAAARIIDTVALFIAAIGGSAVVGILLVALEATGRINPGWQSRLGEGTGLGFVLGLVGSLVAMALSEAIGGASLGKLLLGYRVVSLETFRPCTTKQALIRSAGYFFDALFFGAIAWSSMNGSAHRQRYGDVWAGTAVVKARTLPESAKQPLLVAIAGILLALVARGTIAAADIVFRVWA